MATQAKIDSIVDAARIAKLFTAQRAHQATVKRTTAHERIAKLAKLRDAIIARESQIRDALFADFRKPATEADITEIFAVLVELKDAIKSLPKWMRPHKVPTPLSLFGTASAIHYEPRGVVLIIAPWNYPFQLAIAPLIAAVAAGNCAILKPSELTPKTSAILAELVGAVFDEREVAVVEGDAAVAGQLLAQPFDHYFFTGSTKVGKIVAEAAAKHLATTTLELGGKSPAIVDESADLAATAQRLVWGKFVNAGQTCIAPDYVLVDKAHEAALVDELRAAIDRSYGSSDDARRDSQDLARVIDDRNFARLKKLLDATVEAGAKIEIGGQLDARERYIAPTVLTGVRADHAIMSEEIFGPILPILTYDRWDDIAATIAARDKPLALYVFAKDRARIDGMIASTTAGGTAVNTTVLHFANSHLPFGGVGPSGSGSYHGFFGFRTFSHERGVLRQGWPDSTKRIYPPYNDGVKKFLGWMFKLFT